jgi:hypothetical protein
MSHFRSWSPRTILALKCAHRDDGDAGHVFDSEHDLRRVRATNRQATLGPARPQTQGQQVQLPAASALRTQHRTAPEWRRRDCGSKDIDPGRPPVPELALTNATTASFAPGLRAGFVAILSDMIVTYLQEQRLERARAVGSPTDAHQQANVPVSRPCAMILWFAA